MFTVRNIDHVASILDYVTGVVSYALLIKIAAMVLFLWLRTWVI